MTVDNDIYNRPGDIWWDEHQPLHTIRTALNPARLEYFARVFAETGIDPAGLSMVDIGCGGGLLAEELAAMGARVVGVDPSSSSLATAERHAADTGLAVDYRVGTGEHLPLEDASVDVACCVDVLEHVQDLDAVVAETARVLKPGGLYLYDTINRTGLSRTVMIKLFQEWSATAWMPADLHDWDQFITPAELVAVLDRHGLDNKGNVGMSPSAAPPALFRLLRKLKKGQITHGDFGHRARMKLTKDLRVSYLGYAVKRP